MKDNKEKKEKEEIAKVKTTIISEKYKKKENNVVSDFPKKDEKWQNDDITNENIDKLFFQLLQSRNGNEKNFFNEKIKQAKNDFFKINLNKFDLNLVNSIFTRREDDINKELNNIEFEIDFGTYDFQKKFFSKYILIKHKDYYSEEEKARYLEVKVNFSNSNFIFITKERMGELLSKFRKIYKSFCNIKSFLNDTAIRKFDERFDFEMFAIIEDEVNEKLKIEENFNSFEIKWEPNEFFGIYSKEDDLNNSDDIIEPNPQDDYLKKYAIGLFKKNIYSTIKTITGIFDLSNDKIIALIIREHKDLFEYFLKNKKLLKLEEANKKARETKEGGGGVLPAQDKKISGVETK